MPSADFPVWTLLPFPALVLGIAIFPLLTPRYWEKRSFQIAVTLACALPVVVYELGQARAARQLFISRGTALVCLGEDSSSCSARCSRRPAAFT